MELETFNTQRALNTRETYARLVQKTNIPTDMHESIIAYLTEGTVPGPFLIAVLSNDLKGACLLATPINRRYLYEYVNFLHQNAPTASWGTPHKYLEWTDAGKRQAEV